MRKVRDLSEKEKKDFLRDVVQNWGKESPEKIAKRWNFSKQKVHSSVAYLRKKGVNVPKLKIVSKFLTPEFIEELNVLAKKKKALPLE